jgi:hypothetical protein
MKLKIFYAACIAAVALSCGNKMQEARTPSDDISLAKPEETESTKNSLEENKIVAADTSAMTIQNSTDKNVLQSGNPSPDWDKKIIKTANVTLELKDYNAYNNAINAKLKEFGAYVAQEQQSKNDEQISNNITIKVPVDKFDDLMNSLSGDDIKMLEKNVSTEDVTGEVIDTKARIEAMQQARAKYLELLKQAKNMNDILQVQNEINSIQEEIESATGRVNYLVHASAYSTINLRYYQYLNGLTSKAAEPNFYTRVSDAFKTGASVIIDLVLFVISVWPLTIAAIVLIIYLRRSKLLSKVQNVQVSDTTKV